MDAATVDHEVRQRHAGWSWKALLLAIVGIATLFVLRAMSGTSFRAAVEAAGGTLHKEYPPGTAVIFGGNLTVRASHWRVSFDRGTVDDAWLQAHHADLAEPKSLTLTLQNTRVSSVGLQHVGGLKNLDALILTGTPLQPEALDAIANLRVPVLHIAQTGISGQELVRLSSMTTLSGLEIDNRQALDGGLEALNRVTTVQNLSILDANDETVSAIDSVTLKNVKALTLQGSGVTTASLSLLARLKGLEVLTLTGTSLNADHLQQLRAALPACHVQSWPPF